MKYYEKYTNHCTITKEGTTSAERVGDDVEGSDFGRLEVEEGAPCGVAVDLQRVIGRAIEEDGEVRVDDHGLERNDARRLGLQVELPRGDGRRRRCGMS